MVNLEDLWLARDPQNVPGTGKERPNWRRKAEHTLEEILRHPRFADILRGLDAARREA
jgi:4-alpha-glucanotransferase